MEILILDPTYDREESAGKDRKKEITDKLSDLEPKFKIKETEIGHGADWPVWLVSFGGIFLLGAPIEKNFNAWVSLAKRFAEFFKEAKEKYVARVDRQAAKFLAIDDLIKNDEIKSISVVKEDTIVFDAFPENKAGTLDKEPGALYLITLEVNGDMIFVYGIKSKGSIEFKHKFSKLHYEF